MPREVVQLHIGQCGVQLAKSIWPQLCLEHYLTLDGMKQEGFDDSNFRIPNSFFYESDGGNT